MGGGAIPTLSDQPSIAAGRRRPHRRRRLSPRADLWCPSAGGGREGCGRVVVAAAAVKCQRGERCGRGEREGRASERRGGVRRAVRGGRYRMGRGRGGGGGRGDTYRFATRMPASRPWPCAVGWVEVGGPWLALWRSPSSVLTPTSGENERISKPPRPGKARSTLGKSRVAVVRRRSRSRRLRLALLTPVPPHVSQLTTR